MNYWDNFYTKAKDAKLSQPSQFAAFVAGEISPGSYIIDIGCGNGRDSLFFSSLEHNVCGIDKSEEAINFCNALTSSKSLKAQFLNSDINNAKIFPNILNNFCDLKNVQEIIFYSRFFLHTITEENQHKLLLNIKEISKIKKVSTFFEFRTEKDSNLPKETKEHYRRYIEPFSFINKAVLIGYSVEYFIEGFGFAKYRNDDAHVARIILSINPEDV